MDWFKENWFRLSLVAILFIGALIATDTLILQPREASRQQAAAELAMRRAAEEAQAKAEEKTASLNTCLEESEFQRNTGHLALCGDPNIGKSPKSCHAVFGGASNRFQILANYKIEFPGELHELSDYEYLDTFDAILEVTNQNSIIIDDFWDTCNCGLVGALRDRLDEERDKRDEICMAKYGS